MEVKPHQLLGAAVPQVGVLTHRDFVSFVTSENMEIKWIFIPTLGLLSLHGQSHPSGVGGGRRGISVSFRCGRLQCGPSLPAATGPGWFGSCCGCSPRGGFTLLGGRSRRQTGLLGNLGSRKKKQPHQKSPLELRFGLSDHERLLQNQRQKKVQFGGEMELFSPHNPTNLHFCHMATASPISCFSLSFYPPMGCKHVKTTFLVIFIHFCTNTTPPPPPPNHFRAVVALVKQEFVS